MPPSKCKIREFLVFDEVRAELVWDISRSLRLHEEEIIIIFGLPVIWTDLTRDPSNHVVSRKN